MKSWCNSQIIPYHFVFAFLFSPLFVVLEFLKVHSFCVEDPQLGHEVEVDEGQADQ